MALTPHVRLTVNPGRVVHMGAHAFPEGDAITVPAAHAEELQRLGHARPETVADAAAPAPGAEIELVTEASPKKVPEPPPEPPPGPPPDNPA